MADLLQLTRQLLHDPGDPQLRSPVGAVACGTTVRVGMLVLADAADAVADVTLAIRRLDGRPDVRVETSGAVKPDGSAVFSAEVPVQDEPCVLLYRFEVLIPSGETVVYTPRRDGRALSGETLTQQDSMDSETPWFQLTVYDPAFTTPPWMHGAVMYQIFPDRFARGGAAGEAIVEKGVAAHRDLGRPVRLHASWDDAPDWHDPGSLDTDGRYDPVDFFGGTLAGIESRLDYLSSMGVDVVYLNPVFEARSNHRYDTADYLRIDPLLGDLEAFRALCRAARDRGIRIVLDAVLSHTGDDSVYFNARGTYDAPGAMQGPQSPFYAWFDFDHPNGDLAPYRCWWGEPSLPEVDERDGGWQRFMLGEKGVLPYWMHQGAAGYRLDVADELPDDVLEKIRATVKDADESACIIGEVWEDPTTKVSYGAPRTYALGRALDSVMNYPLRSALVDFALGKRDAHQLVTFLRHQQLDYPPALYASLMNLLGSHDVERLRSILALGGSFKHLDRPGQLAAVADITPQADATAAQLQAMLATMTYMLPGMPCLYYGDERGLHGGADPFCRATMPWDSDAVRADMGVGLTDVYRALGNLRHDHKALRTGDVAFAALGDDVVCIARHMNGDHSQDGSIVCLANRSDKARTVALDVAALLPMATIGQAAHLIPFNIPPQGAHTPSTISLDASVALLTLPPRSAIVFQIIAGV